MLSLLNPRRRLGDVHKSSLIIIMCCCVGVWAARPASTDQLVPMGPQHSKMEARMGASGGLPGLEPAPRRTPTAVITRRARRSKWVLCPQLFFFWSERPSAGRGGGVGCWRDVDMGSRCVLLFNGSSGSIRASQLSVASQEGCCAASCARKKCQKAHKRKTCPANQSINQSIKCFF